MTRIVTLDLDAMPADAQRSFSMLRNTKRDLWGKYVKDSKSRVSETVVPVEPTKPKLTVVYERPMTKAEKEKAENIRLKKQLAKLERKATKVNKPKAITKSDDFYDEVIVGGRDERIEKRPYRCPVKGCYKFGKTFTANGWNGTDANKGHVDLAHEGDSKVTKAALAYRLK